VVQHLKALSLAQEEGKTIDKEEKLRLITPIIKLWTQTYKQIKDAKFSNIKNSELMSENPI
jgi:hypothetical protein